MRNIILILHDQTDDNLSNVRITDEAETINSKILLYLFVMMTDYIFCAIKTVQLKRLLRDRTMKFVVDFSTICGWSERCAIAILQISKYVVCFVKPCGTSERYHWFLNYYVSF